MFYKRYSKDSDEGLNVIEKTLKNSRENISIPMLIGIFLVGVCFFLIFVTSLLFIFGIHITVIHFPFAVLLSAMVCFFLSGRSPKKTYAAVAIGLLVICVFGIMNCFIPDYTWDGNGYHKVMAGFLRYGWNPLRETVYEFSNKNFPLVVELANFEDAYPKGSEIIAACFYRFTGNVEIGKIFNLISIAGAMCICAALLMEAAHLKKWQAWVCAAIFTVHPVSISQAFTYYNDGFLWQMILLCTACCLYLLFFEKGRYQRICLFLVFATICIGFNIKFSGVIFFAFPCAGLFVLWMIRLLRQNHTKEGYRKVLQGIGFFAVSVLCGLLLCGSTSYVVNTVRYHNPLYSIVGEGANEIIVSQMPNELFQNSEIKRVVKALLSDYGANGVFGYKLPLLFSKASVNNRTWGHDGRIGGWGILFSDLLVAGTLILAIVWYRNLKKRRLLCRVMETFVLLGLIAVITVPGLWWARYFVAPFYIPACALVALFYTFNHKSGSIVPFAAGCLVALFFVNVVPDFMNNIEWYQRYESTSFEWERMRTIATREPLTVTFKNSQGYSFFGRLFNLLDSGITNYQYVQDQLDGMRAIYQDYPIFYSDPNYGVWAAYDLVDYLDQVQEMEDVTLLISVKDDASNGLTENMIHSMQDLGLQFDMRNRYRSSYIAIVENGQVLYEEVSNDLLSYSGSIGQKKIALTSAGYTCGDVASINIDGVECAVNSRGINIVLVDTRTGGLLDSVVFDTYETGACIHK